MAPLTSPHIERIAIAVADGAHVLVLGHLGDVVLWRGHTLTEAAAIAAELERVAGTALVAVADAADGMRPLDPAQRPDFEPLLAASDPGGEVRLDRPSAIDIARATRRFLGQRERAVDVLLRDTDLLLDTGSDTGRRAVATLRRAMEEAVCVEGSMPVPHRNALVVLAGRGLPCLEGVRDLVEVQASPPDERILTALADLRREGFHRPPGTGAAEPGRTDPSFARVLRPDAAHGIERARRASHAIRTGLDEPVRLARAVARRGGSGRMFDSLDIGALEAQLHADIGGQPDAIERVVAALRAARGGNRHRPVAEAAQAPRVRLVLTGPAGVGKGELSRAVQRSISGSPKDMVRFDCAAELTSEHDVARLVGAPPGFVGYEDGGRLTEALAANPARVVLFDEFDKIHPGVAGALLSIVEDGSLRDGRGRDTDFSQCILVITSNHGSRQLIGYMRDPAGPPPTKRFLENSRGLAEEGICAIPRSGAPLWSRFADGWIGFDMLRRPAIPDIVAPVARSVEASLGADYRVALAIDHGSLARAVERELPADGYWDGRTVSFPGGVIDRIFTRPLEAALATIPTGSGVRAWVDPADGLQVAVVDCPPIDPARGARVMRT